MKRHEDPQQQQRNTVGADTSSDCAVVLGVLRQAGPPICSFRVACITMQSLNTSCHLLFVLYLDNQTFNLTVAVNLMMLHAGRCGRLHHKHAGLECPVYVHALCICTLCYEHTANASMDSSSISMMPTCTKRGNCLRARLSSSCCTEEEEKEAASSCRLSTACCTEEGASSRRH